MKGGGGGDFVSGNQFFFCTPIEEIFFFFSLDAWEDFFFLDQITIGDLPPRNREIGTTSFILTTNRAAFFPFWVNR